jgi:uncharacterized protein YecE (DUF72 family)
MSTGQLYIRTSGWSYKHWRGSFYPANLPVSGQLEYYSQHFNATEINSSFYKLPLPSTVRHWQETVPKTFRFCPKISRFITHAKKLNDPQQACPRFFDVFNPYRNNCGPILIQLPAILTFNAERTNTFFSYLRNNYKGWSFSLEARHETWSSPGALALLKRLRVGWVIADSGDRWASSEIVTARHIYLRFHGPDGSYATSYTTATLKAWARKCRGWLDQGHNLWIFFNNDIHGYATDNARTLAKLLGRPLRT